MKRGDIVVCINVETYQLGKSTVNDGKELTLGKRYILLDIRNRPLYQGHFHFKVINDRGYEEYFSPFRFRLLSEIRKEKLEKLSVVT